MSNAFSFVWHAELDFAKKKRSDREIDTVTTPFHGPSEEDIFAAALALPAPERASYLERACRNSTGLFERLTGMMNAFGDASNFVGDDVPVAHPSQIGPYQLLRELGEGGCGVAYFAEQTTPVKRQVALKVVKPGMDTKAVIARFEAERQVLALLDHPNVAKVFDAGATSEGRPYFVMELVRGVRITEFCDQSRLTVSERLSLFVQVCQAIQHAHQKGIIHRDIKPSNVLVTMHDGQALAKVIDFGIAKATQGRLTDHTIHTEIDQILGTPAYISPEQTDRGHIAVDTRCDIYSLGVLLYELLTGHTPFDAYELAQTSIERLRERIRTEEPPRPSRRLDALASGPLARVSIARGTIAAKLVGQIRDDLDWIVMQCMEKEASRRYQAVNELIADVGRHLRREPIAARPPSFSYTVRKLARRKRAAFAAAFIAVAFVVFITAFAVMMTVQAQRVATERDQAERERQRAEKVSQVALKVFTIADPFNNVGKDVDGSALLERAARSIEYELTDQPGARAQLLKAVGVAHSRRGEWKLSIDYLSDAVRIFKFVPGAEAEALRGMAGLSAVQSRSGHRHEAHRTLADAEHLARQFGLLRSPSYAELLLARGRIHLQESRVSAARADFEQALRIYKEKLGPQSVGVAEALADLTQTFLWTDDFVKAETTAKQAIEVFDLTVPPMYPDRVSAEESLAEALYLQNKLDDAALLLEGAIRKKTELFGRNSIEVVDALDRFAVVRHAQRRFREAEELSREAIAICRMVLADKHVGRANILTTLGRALAERGKYSEAEAALREALDIYLTTLPASHQYTASTEYLLGELLLTTDRLSEAEAVLTASMDRWRRSGAPPWRAMRSASALGEAIYRQGRVEEAKRYLAASFVELAADPKADLEAKDKARKRVERYLQKSATEPQQVSSTSL